MATGSYFDVVIRSPETDICVRQIQRVIARLRELSDWTQGQ